MPNNDVEELSKIPQLVRHYQYHRAIQGKTLTIGLFLRMHYGGDEHQVAAAADHGELPFIGDHHFPNLEYIVPALQLVVPTAAHPESARDYRLATSSRYRFAFCASLLQPPRA